jgi:hypothetical protein
VFLNTSAIGAIGIYRSSRAAMQYKALGLVVLLDLDVPLAVYGDNGRVKSYFRSSRESRGSQTQTAARLG